MNAIRVLLDGVEVTDPLNLSELELELNFDEDSNYSQSVSVSSLTFGVGDGTKPNDGYNLIKGRLNKSLIAGGVGVEEGVPLQVYITDIKTNQKKQFDGIADLWEASYRNGEVDVPIRDFGRIDWLNDQLDSVSFEYLESIGKITRSDYIDIPYCIEKKQNAIEIALTLVTIFTITDKISDEIAKIQEMTASAANPFEATVIARLVIRILYIAFLMASLATLIIQLYNLVAQPVKYHTGMNVFKALQVGLKHLGFDFSSSILNKFPYNKLYVLPEKNNLEENNSIKYLVGNLISGKAGEKGYFKGTLGDLYRELKTIFNARTIIKNGVVYFEKYNFTLSSAKYQLPNLLDAVYTYGFNKNDFYSNILISFAYDTSDRNTIQEWKGTSFQVIQEQIAVTNIKYKLTQNFKQVRTRFALGKRKTSLNFIEEIMSAFFKVIGTVVDILVSVINTIIDVINGIIGLINDVIDALEFVGIDLGFDIPSIPNIEFPSIKNLIEDRIGMLKMESDFVNVPKLLLIDDKIGDSLKTNARENKLLADAETYLSAKYLYENFHYFISFVPDAQGNHNQYLIKSFENIPFTYSDYEKVTENNRIFVEMPDGKVEEAILTNLKFNPYKQTANGSYKQKFQYISNLKETKIEPDGK